MINPVLFIEAVAFIALILAVLVLALLSKDQRVQAVAFLLFFAWFFTVLTGGKTNPVWVEVALSGVFVVAFAWFQMPSDDEYYTNPMAGEWVTRLFWPELVVFVCFFLVFLGVLTVRIHSFMIDAVFAWHIGYTGWTGFRIWRASKSR